MRKWNILAVDNDPDSLRQIYDVLFEEKYISSIFLERTGRAGLSRLTKDPIDLIILDHDLGNESISATEVLSTLRENEYDQPVVMITQRPENLEQIMNLSSDYQISSYSLKPVSHEKLSPAVLKNLEEYQNKKPFIHLVTRNAKSKQIKELAELVQLSGLNVVIKHDTTKTQDYFQVINLDPLNPEAIEVMKSIVNLPNNTQNIPSLKKEANRLLFGSRLLEKTSIQQNQFVPHYVNELIDYFELREKLIRVGLISNGEDEDLVMLDYHLPLSYDITLKSGPIALAGLDKKLMDETIIKRIPWQDFVDEQLLDQAGENYIITKKLARERKKQYEDAFSLLKSISPKGSLLFRKESRLKDIASQHETYLIEHPILKDHSLMLIIKKFSKFDGDTDISQQTKQLAKTEEHMAWLRWIRSNENELDSRPYIASYEDQYNFYLIRPYVELDENYPFLRQAIGLNHIPKGISALDYIDLISKAMKESKVQKTDGINEIMTVLFQRVDKTIDSLLERNDYLTIESLDVNERVQKNYQRYITPLKDMGLLPDPDDIKDILLGQLFINSYIDRYPTYPGTDCILANLIGPLKVPQTIDPERVKSITLMGELSLTFNPLNFDLETVLFDIPQSLDQIGLKKYESIEDVRQNPTAIQALRKMGLSNGEISEETMINARELLSRYFFKTYNQRVVNEGRRKKNPFRDMMRLYTRELTSDESPYGKMGSDLLKKIKSIPPPKSIYEYFQIINDEIERMDSNIFYREIRNRSRRIMREVTYTDFESLDNETRKKRLKHIILNEFRYFNQARILKPKNGESHQSNLLASIHKLPNGKGLDYYTKKIQKAVEDIGVEGLTRKSQQIFSYLKHLNSARPRTVIDDFTTFYNDPSSIQKIFELFGTRKKFLYKARTGRIRKRESEILLQMSSNIITYFNQFQNYVPGREKKMLLEDFISASSPKFDAKQFRQYGIFVKDLRIPVSQVLEKFGTKISEIHSRMVQQERHLLAHNYGK